MQQGLTEIVFILDRSGSMAGREADTIGGFNAMLEKQKREPGEAYLSTVLFDGQSEVLHDRLKLGDVPPLTERDYAVRGYTALLDAIGGAIRHIGNIHKYARPEDVPERTLFVITTDGMENASHRYDRETVRAMVERQKARYGWEFLFLGANIDAIGTAGAIGIPPDRAADFHNDGQGIETNFRAVSDAVSAVRCAQPLAADWADEVRRDHAARMKAKKPM